MTFVTAGPLRLWTERFGDPGHPAVLLIMGSAAQGLTCPDGLIDRLVARGAQAIRYDHRDTGRSSVVDFEANPYGISDMAGDAVAVLDAYGIASAHLVGASLGGVIAQWLAVHEPARVRSLTLLSTTPMGRDPGPAQRRARNGQPADPDDLPPPAPRFLRHLADSRDTPPGVEADVELFRVMNGEARQFDESATRSMLERCWGRASDPAAAGNHHRAASRMSPDLLVPLTTITAPTAVLHGDQDPVLPLAHGAALAAAIPQAQLHVVPGMGHVYLSPGLPEELADLVLLTP